MKVADLGKRICIGIVIAISFLALISFLVPGPVVRAQTQSNSTSSNSATIASAISAESNSSVPSSTQDYVPTSTSNSTAPLTTSMSLSSNGTVIADTSSVASNTSTITNTSGSAVLTSTQNDAVTVTVTSVATPATTWDRTWLSSMAAYGDYSISFNPPYWFCSDVSVTFTGPLVESGFYGDTLQFQYFQYNSAYPSILTPIFTDSGLTVTSDVVNYWISSAEYSQVNFAYQPNIAVKIIDLTPRPNGYTPGLIYMDLTSITPEGGPSCPSPAPAPEFQVQWSVIVSSILLSLVFLRARKLPQQVSGLVRSNHSRM